MGNHSHPRKELLSMGAHSNLSINTQAMLPKRILHQLYTLHTFMCSFKIVEIWILPLLHLLPLQFMKQMSLQILSLSKEVNRKQN
jgi:hypothetical protein